MEPLQPTNGDQMPGHGHVRVLGPLDSPGAANVANANNRRLVVSPNYGKQTAFILKYPHHNGFLGDGGFKYEVVMCFLFFLPEVITCKSV